MKATRRTVLTTALGIAVAGRLPIGLARAAEEPKRGGTLVVVSAENPRHFNTAVQSGTPTGIPGAQIFASPLRFDADWKPQPYLAESWDWSEDGLALTLHMRKDARFHDGHPITSADVKFSIEANKANHPFKTKFAAVDTIETPDEHTAVIKLAKHHPALLLSLSPVLAPIIPKHIYDDGQDLKTHPRNADPVGSGPFKLKEFKPGEHILLERYEDYVLSDGPFLDQILIKIVPNISSHSIGLESGEYHLATATSLTIRDWKRLGEQPHLTATKNGYEAVGALNWLAFNTAKAPFDNKKVRQAISFATDRNFIVNVLQQGGTMRATGPIAPGSPFYSDEVEHYDVDLDRAQALLEEAGYPMKDGKRLKVTVDFYPGYDEQQKLVAEYLRPQLKKIGVEVEVRTSADFGAWADRISNWDFEMTMDNVYNWGDPVIGVHRTYECSNRIKGVIWSNTQQYCNERVDELMTAAATEMDLDKRKALYKEFQQIVVDDVPIAFINADPLRTVYRDIVGNPPLTIWGAMSPMDDTFLKA